MKSKKSSACSPLEAWEELQTKMASMVDDTTRVLIASQQGIIAQRKRQVVERDCAWDLIAMAENMLLHHGKDMFPGDRSGREKVLERARKLWHPRP